MNPIINPWIFYWMELADTVKKSFTILSFIGLSISICVFAYMFIEENEFDDDSDSSYVNRIRKYKALALKWVIVCIVMVVIAFIIPSAQTISRMVIAQYATPDNIESAFTAVLDGANRLMEVVKQ